MRSKSMSKKSTRKTQSNVLVFHRQTYLDPYHEVGLEEIYEIPGILTCLTPDEHEVLIYYISGLNVRKISHMSGFRQREVRLHLQRARESAHRLIDQKRKEEMRELMK